MTRKTRSRALAPVAVAGALALVATACGGAGGTEGTSGSSGGGGQPTIGVSVPTVEGPFFTGMLYGILDEAKKEGYQVTILSAGSYANVAEQVSDIETLAAQQVDIMLVDPADPAATRGPIRQAVSQGITVVGAGDPAEGADGSVSASHCDVGKAFAVGAKELLPDGGSLAVLAGPAGAFWSTKRLECFKQDLQGSNIEIVAEQTSNPDVAEGLRISSDFLQRFPELDLLYGADDTVGVGAAKAVQAAHRCGETKVITAVFGKQAESLMTEGCVDYDVALQPVLIGREAVRLGIQLNQGNQPAETEMTVPTVPVTPENISEVDIGAIRAPDGWKPPV